MHKFESNFVGCELTRLWYDAAKSDESISNNPTMEISPNCIVFLSDFDVITGYDGMDMDSAPHGRRQRMANRWLGAVLTG